MFTSIPFENGWSSCRKHQTLCSKHERTSKPADRIVIPACCCRGLYRCPFKIYIRINPIDTSRIQCIQRITLINPFLPYVFSNCCQLLLFSFGKILSYNRSMIDAASSAYRRRLFELQPTRINFFDQWTVFERYGWAAAKSNRKPPDRLPRDPTIQ